MPRNGSGSYSLPQAAFVAGTTISSAAVNSDLSDIATALTGSLPRDGQAGMTGQLKIPDGSSLAPALSFSNELNTGFTRSGSGQVGLTILGTQLFTFSATGATGSFQGNIPAGTIVDFAGASAPAGWLLCFGQAISRTTNALLFTAIGTIWGSGDGFATFNIPDCRDYALVGKGDMGGSDAGRLTTAFYGTSPIVLGNPGGAQSRVLTTPNLPAYTPAGSGTATAPQNNFATGTGTEVIGYTAGATNKSILTGPVASNSGSVVSFTGTSQGGTSTAFASVQPSLIMNKIIYTGG